ncbi:unnamed protein product [Nyctereutes procyonoides]|uniref:(raccoon dog) hypothetical protein n=1 Tax=Nyctereutes procyonoides TaxID=34880 RepID=A0A811XPP5_NYCPR|nr:unnamed protein product [Nyctereutes procyonoides]
MSIPLYTETTASLSIIFRWTPRLLPLFGYCGHCCYKHRVQVSRGEDSQTVVAQESSVSVSPRGTVTLTCGLSSGSQTQGRSPCMLISDTSSHSSEVPDRFSGSISGNKAALTITGAQPEDEADY